MWWTDPAPWSARGRSGRSEASWVRPGAVEAGEAGGVSHIARAGKSSSAMKKPKADRPLGTTSARVKVANGSSTITPGWSGLTINPHQVQACADRQWTTKASRSPSGRRGQRIGRRRRLPDRETSPHPAERPARARQAKEGMPTGTEKTGSPTIGRCPAAARMRSGTGNIVTGVPGSQSRRSQVRDITARRNSTVLFQPGAASVRVYRKRCATRRRGQRRHRVG